jgi:AP-2 complex subunit alpha
MVRLTIRATDDLVPPILLRLMVARLAVGAPVAAPEKESLTRREVGEVFKNIMVT